MNEKILVIDPEPDSLRFLELLLRHEKYQVQSTSGSKEAISIFKAEPFDLIITEIRMPGLDGLELIRQLKKLNDDVEIIVLTGSPTFDNIVQAMRGNGAFDLFTKPLKNIDPLIDSIAQALQRRRLKREKSTSS